MAPFSREREGFTYVTENLLKLLGIIVVVALLFLIAGEELIPLIDMLAELLGLNPYEQEALNTGAAISYAMSCTSLIQSYHAGGDSGCAGGASDEICGAIESDFTSGPATPKIPRSCREATEGDGTKFGEVRVKCDTLEGAGGTASDMGCNVYNWQLPQPHASSDVDIEQLTNFLLGNGHPKYLIYYNKFNNKYASDWEYRIEKNSLWVLAAGMFASGVLTAAIPMGSATSAAGSRSTRELAEAAWSRFWRAWDEGLITTMSRRLRSWGDAIGGGVRDAVDHLIGMIRRARVTGAAGLRTVSQLARLPRSELDSAVTRNRFRKDVLESFGDDVPPSVANDMDELWDNGVRELYTTRSDEISDYYANGEMGVIDNEVAQVWDDAIRNADLEDDVASTLRSQFVDISTGGSGIRRNVHSILAKENGQRIIQNTRIDKALYHITTGKYDKFAYKVRYGIQESGGVPQFALEKSKQGAKGMLSWGASGASSGTRAGARTVEQNMKRLGQFACGSSGIGFMAASLYAQDVGQDHISQENAEVRAFLSAAPTVSMAGVNNILPAFSKACRNGGNPFRAIANAGAGAGGIAVAYVTASIAAGLQKEVQMAIIREPQGVNSIYVARPWFYPEEFPLNEHANWWYQNMHPNQANLATIGVEGQDRRFYLASPCHASGSGDALAGSSELEADEPEPQIQFRRDTLSVELKPAGGIAGYWGDGIKQGESRDNTCVWARPDDYYSRYRGARSTTEKQCIPDDSRYTHKNGGISNCQAIEREDVCGALDGCDWIPSQTVCLPNKGGMETPEGEDDTDPRRGARQADCNDISAEAAEFDSREEAKQACQNSNVRADEYTGWDEVNSSELQAMAGSYYRATNDKIMYNDHAIVNPVVGDRNSPPGTEYKDPRVDGDEVGGSNEFVTAVPMEGAREGDTYIVQQGYFEDGSEDVIVPTPSINKDGIGARKPTYQGMFGKVQDAMDDFFDWIPFGLGEGLESDVLDYQLDAVSATMYTDFSQSPEGGANYCYGKRGIVADLAKVSTVAVAFGAELILDTVGLASGPLSIGAQFLIGMLEHGAWFAVENSVADHWPNG